VRKIDLMHNKIICMLLPGIVEIHRFKIAADSYKDFKSGVQQSSSPYSRRSVELSVVNVDGRPVPISLQRFKPPDGDAVWLFFPFATIITALLFRIYLTEFVILTGPVASWLDIASEAIGVGWM
jgi:hypothetical protein